MDKLALFFSIYFLSQLQSFQLLHKRDNTCKLNAIAQSVSYITKMHLVTVMFEIFKMDKNRHMPINSCINLSKTIVQLY